MTTTRVRSVIVIAAVLGVALGSAGAAWMGAPTELRRATIRAVADEIFAADRPDAAVWLGLGLAISLVLTLRPEGRGTNVPLRAPRPRRRVRTQVPLPRILLTVLALAVGVAPALAQDEGVRVKAPSPAPRVLPLTPQYQVTRPSDDNYTIGGARILYDYDPAFVGALSVLTETATSTGRMGLARWSTPNAPLGGSVNGSREINGWLGFGFAVSWGGPAPPKVALPAQRPEDAARLKAVDGESFRGAAQVVPVPSSHSRRVPREARDAPEEQPKEAPRQLGLR
jgi:hypothetical protein